MMAELHRLGQSCTGNIRLYAEALIRFFRIYLMLLGLRHMTTSPFMVLEHMVNFMMGVPWLLVRYHELFPILQSASHHCALSLIFHRTGI